jgi:hypothetical protein
LGGEENPTQFFEYKEHSEQDKEQFMAYLKANDQVTEKREKWNVSGGKGIMKISNIHAWMKILPHDMVM